MTRRLIPALAALLAACAIGADAPSPDQNLLPNGDFERADAAGLPADWFRVPGGDVSRQAEGENHFLRLSVTKAGESALVQRETALDASTKALNLTFRARYKDIAKGAKGWNDGRIQIIFLNNAHKTMGQPVVADFKGSAADWQPQTLLAAVPEGAEKVKLQLGLFSVAHGTLDLDDLKLTPADAPPEPATPVATDAPATQPLPYTLLSANFDGAKLEGKSLAGWTVMAGTPTVDKDADHSFVHLQAEDGASAQLRRFLPLNPDWARVTLSTRVRYRGVKAGEHGWQNARIIVEFTDAKGKGLGTPPPALNWRGSSKAGWVDETRDYAIPFGAAQMKIDPALLMVKSGTLDIQSISVVVVESRSAAARASVLPEAWKPAMTPHWIEKTATRESICLNGVWAIRPIGLSPGDPKKVTAGVIQNPPLPGPMPAGLDWGYGKVPSTFPGSKESGTEWALPEAWSGVKWADTDAAWFRRTVDVPQDFAGKRIVLDVDTLQSQAAVFIDDKLVGQLVYPAGVIDLTKFVTPGKSATLTLFVIAKPFDEARVHAMNPNEVYLETAELKQRGLCGDVFLRAEPQTSRLESIQFRPSVRKQQLGLHISTAGTSDTVKLHVAAAIDGKTEADWTSDPLRADANGNVDAAMPWLAKNLWDTDSPKLYDVTVQLLDAGGKLLDERHEKTGYRELWLDGRDIMLNGSPIHWRVSKIGNDFAGRSKSRMIETFHRMQSLGFNCCILDYDVNPGSAPSYTPLYEAADETGMIVVATIPSLIPWQGELPDDAARAKWQKLTNYCVAIAQNHPSVLCYATNHNRLGWPGALNPYKIDGLHDPVSPDDAFNTKRKIGLEAEAYVRQQDPTRELYHHSGGNIGTWETDNCYLNWMPMQERRDYVEHWSQAGVKPLFLTEFGMPFVASWGRYRGPGVYKPSSDTEPLFIEYSAALTGAHAYDGGDSEGAYVDAYENAYKKAGRSSWATLTNSFMRRAVEWNFVEIQSRVARETFPAMRTYGLSALLPWDYKSVANWTDKTPAKVTLTEPPEQWTTPGIHGDFDAGFGYGNDQTYFNAAAPADTYKLTSLAEAYKAVNSDVLVWIAGSPDHFTERSHVFAPGDSVTKQIIAINDRRHELKVHFDATITVAGKTIETRSGDLTIAAGRQQRQPLQFSIPADVQGDGAIDLSVTGADGFTQKDHFDFQVVAKPSTPQTDGIALWDPSGETTKEFERLGAHVPAIKDNVPDNVRCLIIGRRAVTPEAPLPDVRGLLSRGGKVVVMEQTEQTLNRRFGFRTSTASLRNVFVRMGDHPLLKGLNDALLHDWAGAATLTADKMSGLPEFEAKYPGVSWLGFRNLRVWKVNNLGQLASVVIEKPQTGDFLPLIDGGFDLQYSPLLLSRVGGGEVLFCQLDVTGRTAVDPAAGRVLSNILAWATTPASNAPAAATYVGDDQTKAFLTSLGATLGDSAMPTTVIGPKADAPAVAAALSTVKDSGGTCVMLWPAADALPALGDAVKAETANLVSDQAPPEVLKQPLLAGVGPSELHLRSRTTITRVEPKDGWHTPQGMIAQMKYGKGTVAFVQIDPRELDYTRKGHVYEKLTFNHTRTLLSRILANSGVQMSSRLLDFWQTPATDGQIDLSQSKWRAADDESASATPEQVTAGTDKLSWYDVSVPGAVDQQPALAKVGGRFWYRLTFDVPAALLKGDQQLTLGCVDDEDTTYLNGQKIGHVGKDTNPADYYKLQRSYRIPAGLLKPSGNVLVIQGNNIQGPCGILEGPASIGAPAQRWLQSFYQDKPVATDDPLRYYRW